MVVFVPKYVSVVSIERPITPPPVAEADPAGTPISGAIHHNDSEDILVAA